MVLSSAIVCDHDRRIAEVCFHMIADDRRTFCDPRSSAIIWKPAFTRSRSLPSPKGKTGKGMFSFGGRVQLLVDELDCNLVPRSHSVTGNVRSGKVQQYTIFYWLLKKGCGNAIYAPIGLFRGARNEGLVFASSCAVLNKYQLCGGKFCFFRRRKSLTVKENHFKNLRRLYKWYRRNLHVPCHSNKVLHSLLRGTQKLINSS